MAKPQTADGSERASVVPTSQATLTRPTTTDQVRFVPKPHTEGDYGKPIDPGYNTFYTTSAKVQYFQANRIEGKSGYLHYVPSDNVVEQRLEKMWYENINKDIAEKRT